jgi:glycosyltransferase involved in cell wall biosynthesis
VAERLSVWLPNETVTDARVIQDYYLATYGARSTMIAYGAEVERRTDRTAVTRWGVEPNRYVLYVSRLEPENNAHTVIEAFAGVRTELPLVVVGDAPYAEEYKRGLRRLADQDPRVVLLGAVYGDGYRALQEGATLYVQATSVGGTHPALVEAMGAGNAIVANDTPEHHEVLAGAGVYYATVPELTARLQSLLDDDGARCRLREAAQAEARGRFSWEAVTDAYEDLVRA